MLFGGIQAAAPLVLWWQPPGTVYALPVAPTAPIVVSVESVVAIFVAFAAAAITGPAGLLVIGLAGPGLRPSWQYRRQFVAGTRRWPSYCCTVDLVVAALVAVEILAGAP